MKVKRQAKCNPMLLHILSIFSKRTPGSVTNLQHTQCTTRQVINLWSPNSFKLPFCGKNTLHKWFLNTAIFNFFIWDRSKCISPCLYFIIWRSNFVQCFFDVVRNPTSSKKYLLDLIKEDQKSTKRICHMNVLKILPNEKHYTKIISQQELDCGLFTKLSRIIAAHDFSQRQPTFLNKINILEDYLSYRAKTFLVKYLM